MVGWASCCIRTSHFRNGKKITNYFYDNSHYIFILFSSKDVLYELGEMETFKGTSIPKNHIIIEDCGLNDITKYELSYEQLGSYGDLVATA